MFPFTGRRLRQPDNLGKCGPFVRVGRLPFGFVRDSMPGLGQSPCRQGVVVITWSDVRRALGSSEPVRRSVMIMCSIGVLANELKTSLEFL